MSRLSRGFKPFEQEVRGLYEALDKGATPESLDPVGYGAESYVFASQNDPTKLIKLPLCEGLSRSDMRYTVRRTVAALALGHAHTQLEQLTGYNDTTLPAVVVEKMDGVSLVRATSADLKLLTPDHLEEAFDTCNYLYRKGLWLEGYVPDDIIVQTDGIGIVDYARAPTNNPYDNLVDLGGMLRHGPRAFKEARHAVSNAFFTICASRLNHAEFASFAEQLYDASRLQLQLGRGGCIAYSSSAFSRAPLEQRPKFWSEG